MRFITSLKNKAGQEEGRITGVMWCPQGSVVLDINPKGPGILSPSEVQRGCSLGFFPLLLWLAARLRMEPLEACAP
jgi:hypothetical protein